MQDINYLSTIGYATDRMSHGGVFLSVGGDKPNTMTVGWGAFGFYWGKPVITMVVRPQRHTHQMLLDAGEFTISVPYDAMAEELKFAGTISGRDVDKFQGHGLTAAPARQVGAPIVAECALHYECKVKLVQSIAPEGLDSAIQSTCYPAHDYHTMFFAEVVACYASGPVPVK